MNRSKSSKIWLKKNFSDFYIKQRNIRNCRSRAWFKLKEIDEKKKIFTFGMNIIDLGAAPGGWSQYAITKIGKKGKILAFDVIPMKKMKNVFFVCGDIFSDLILKKIYFFSKIYTWSVIMSDMCPNISGYSLIDDSKMFFLGKKILNIANKFLSRNGFLIIKFFYGIEFNKFFKKIRSIFVNVSIYKPNSSRINSREVFIIAHEYRV